MQSKNFKDRIVIELDSSYDFIKESLNCMKTYPKWSDVLKKISDDKYDHATRLYRMFMELYLDTKDHDAYMNSLRDTIIEMFATKTRIIDGYRATYDLIVGSEEPPNNDEETQNERDIADQGIG